MLADLVWRRWPQPNCTSIWPSIPWGRSRGISSE